MGGFQKFKKELPGKENYNSLLTDKKSVKTRIRMFSRFNIDLKFKRRKINTT